MTSTNRLLAEAIGTFWIVFAGCGAAVLGSAFPHLGIGVYGVSIAFGLTVVTMLYAIGHVSGGHLNPAVSIGLMIAKRFPAHEVARLHCRASDWGDPRRRCALSHRQRAGGLRAGRLFAAGGVLRRSRALVHVSSYHSGRHRQPGTPGVCPLAISLAVALINLVGIPITNNSLNPARSTGTAVFAEEIGRAHV